MLYLAGLARLPKSWEHALVTVTRWFWPLISTYQQTAERQDLRLQELRLQDSSDNKT